MRWAKQAARGVRRLQALRYAVRRPWQQTAGRMGKTMPATVTSRPATLVIAPLRIKAGTNTYAVARSGNGASGESTGAAIAAPAAVRRGPAFESVSGFPTASATARHRWKRRPDGQFQLCMRVLRTAAFRPDRPATSRRSRVRGGRGATPWRVRRCIRRWIPSCPLRGGRSQPDRPRGRPGAAS